MRNGHRAGDGMPGALLDQRAAVVGEEDDQIGGEHAFQHDPLEQPVAQALIAHAVAPALRHIEGDHVAEHRDAARPSRHGRADDAAREEHERCAQPVGVAPQEELLPDREEQTVVHRPARLQHLHPIAREVLVELALREDIDLRRLVGRQASEQVEEVGLSAPAARRQRVDQQHAHAKGASIRIAHSRGCVSRLPERCRSDSSSTRARSSGKRS